MWAFTCFFVAVAIGFVVAASMIVTVKMQPILNNTNHYQNNDDRWSRHQLKYHSNIKKREIIDVDTMNITSRTNPITGSVRQKRKRNITHYKFSPEKKGNYRIIDNNLDDDYLQLSIEPRIVGGTYVSHRSYPYIELLK